MYKGIMGTDFGSTFFWLTIFGSILLSLGDSLPVVKDYLGGGMTLLLIFGSFAAWAHLLPEKYTAAANAWMAGIKFQAFYITLLIVGAVMAVERKTLLRSLIGYLPCILGGIIGATALGIGCGAVLGIAPGEALMCYVMPVMGAGSAAGALPMSSIYAEVTGGDKNAYYSSAMTSVMIANVLCIFFAVFLDRLGKTFRRFAGDGSQLMRARGNVWNSKDELFYVESTMLDNSSALLVMIGCWVVAGMFSHFFLPRIAGIPIHQYAYLVAVAVVLNISGVLPARLCKGVAIIYEFANVGLAPSCLAGMAISLLDFQSFIDALSVPTLCMCVAIIIGAILGCAAVGLLVGYYPIDAAFCCGLCMANMGGSGDILTLAAGKRMALMSYASISTRIGGAVVLAISGIVFSFFK